MKIYRCTGKDGKGNKFVRTVEADSEEEARSLMEAKGCTVQNLELDHDASNIRTQHDRGNFQGRRKSGVWLNEFLSYAMPVAACVVAICAVPLAVSLFEPKEPKKSPKEVVEKYFDLEKEKNYTEQFSLLTKKMKQRFDGVKDYEKKKRLERAARMGGVSGATALGKLAGIGGFEVKGSRAVVPVRTLHETGINNAEFVLTHFAGRWKIDHLRNPVVVERYLSKLASTENPSDAREIRIQFKAETGYSDLEIRRKLEVYERKQALLEKSKAKAPEYIFTV